MSNVILLSFTRSTGDIDEDALVVRSRADPQGGSRDLGGYLIHTPQLDLPRGTRGVIRRDGRVMRHLFCDVNHSYPLFCLVVRVRFQQLGRSRAETEVGYLGIDVAFYGFGRGCRGTLGSTTKGHVAECAPAALNAVSFYAHAAGGRGGGTSGVGDVKVLQWWPSRVSGVRNGNHIPVSSEMLPENRIVGFADFPALRVEWRLLPIVASSQWAALTMNLRSFEKVNLRAASIRSNGSSESLMLFV